MNKVVFFLSILFSSAWCMADELSRNISLDTNLSQLNDLSARGILKAVQESTLSSELSAAVEIVNFHEGDAFNKGDVLFKFNCEEAISRHKAAQQAVLVKLNKYKTNQELNKYNAVGKLDLLVSQSEYQQSVEESELLAIKIRYCVIKAPFSGQVQALMIAAGETVSENQPLIKIVNPAALEIEVIIPSRWLSKLNVGSDFQFKVDETGDIFSASVIRILPKVDPVSKSIKLIGKIEMKQGTHALPGMSGSAIFNGLK